MFKLDHEAMIPPTYVSPKNFYDRHKKRYIKYVAKRVERFFIRNGKWYNIRPKLCKDRLIIAAAKYMYTLYVLNKFTPSVLLHCTPRAGGGYSMLRRGGLCYIKPKSISCAGEVEFNLLGYKSGSIAALFNQYFKEPVRKDVPGFKKDSDIIMGVRVTAYHLEYVSPEIFRAGPDKFYNMMVSHNVQVMRRSTKLRLLSIAVAIFRMKSHSRKYFNELLSDQSSMRSKIELARAFKNWGVELMTFDERIRKFLASLSPNFNTALNYRRRHNIAYELVAGRLESSSKDVKTTPSYCRILPTLDHHV